MAILEFGPPGTGKTLLAKALASERRTDFTLVGLGDTIRATQSDSGSSENRARALFDGRHALSADH